MPINNRLKLFKRKYSKRKVETVILSNKQILYRIITKSIKDMQNKEF